MAIAGVFIALVAIKLIVNLACFGLLLFFQLVVLAPILKQVFVDMNLLKQACPKTRFSCCCTATWVRTNWDKCITLWLIFTYSEYFKVRYN